MPQFVFHSGILLLLVGAAPLACHAQAASSAPVSPRPDWRIIFNNDTCNILTCQSPYHNVGEDRFTDEMVRASVDEAAVPGVDAMALAPGLGWIPWWPSKIDPMAEHEAWFKIHFGVTPHFAVDDYLLAGGDFIKVFVDECHRKGVAALLSYRLNDAHALDRADGGARPIDVETVSRFYVEHPELRLEHHSTHYGTGTHNWLMPAAPAYKLSLITELLENYDFEGIELDFLRHSNYFPSGTPMSERVAVMVSFVGQVRSVLNRTERNGKHRWLGVRVGHNSADWIDTGFDAAAFRAAGVDYFNLSPYFTSSQQTSIAEVRRAAPDEKDLLEETHSPQAWGAMAGYDGTYYRRNTDEMLKSTARLAYHRGADGISLFNFVYFRAYDPGNGKGGLLEGTTVPKPLNSTHPWNAAAFKNDTNEPPFYVLPTLANPAALEKPPSYFYLAVKNPDSQDVQFHPGNTVNYSMDMAPLSGYPEGRLRLQVLTERESRDSAKAFDAYWNPYGARNEPRVSGNEAQPMEMASRGHWMVMLNGHELAPADEPVAAYPFPTKYAKGFGKADQYLGWRVPPGAAIDGANQVKVAYLDGPPSLRLRWIEVFSYPNKN